LRNSLRPVRPSTTNERNLHVRCPRRARPAERARQGRHTPGARTPGDLPRQQCRPQRPARVLGRHRPRGSRHRTLRCRHPRRGSERVTPAGTRSPRAGRGRGRYRLLPRHAQAPSLIRGAQPGSRHHRAPEHRGNSTTLRRRDHAPYQQQAARVPRRVRRRQSNPRRARRFLRVIEATAHPFRGVGASFSNTWHIKGCALQTRHTWCTLQHCVKHDDLSSKLKQ